MCPNICAGCGVDRCVAMCECHPLENRWTEDTSDQTARFLVRGYFSGDGQHWYRVYDRETGLYDTSYAREVEMARDKAKIRVLVAESLAQPSPFESINKTLDAAFEALKAFE